MTPEQAITDGVDPPTDHDHRWELRDVPPVPASVTAVRRQARAILTRWGAEEMEWVASQLLTEVVSNAVLHAGTPFDVVLTHAPDTVRCEVRDRNPHRPKVRSYSLEASTGRGMHLIDQLATAWGVLPEAGGKTVWFELSPRPDPDKDPYDGGEPDLDALLDSFEHDGDPGPPTTAAA